MKSDFGAFSKGSTLKGQNGDFAIAVSRSENVQNIILDIEERDLELISSLVQKDNILDIL